MHYTLTLPLPFWERLKTQTLRPVRRLAANSALGRQTNTATAIGSPGDFHALRISGDPNVPNVLQYPEEAGVRGEVEYLA